MQFLAGLFEVRYRDLWSTISLQCSMARLGVGKLSRMGRIARTAVFLIQVESVHSQGCRREDSVSPR